MASVDCGKVGTGTDSVPAPPIAVDRDAHLPGARAHQPEMTREQPRVVGRSHRAVRHRRELCARTGERQRHDPHAADVVAGRQDVDVRHAGDRVRRADRHEHTIRTGLPLDEDVGAADVRGRGRLPRDGDEQRRERDPRSARDHRRTLRIARPACSPIHIIRHDVNAARSMPRQNCAAFASR
jgi:hypothetical protein